MGLYRYTGSLQVYSLKVYRVFIGIQGLHRYTGSLQVYRVFTGIQGLYRYGSLQVYRVFTGIHFTDIQGLYR